MNATTPQNRQTGIPACRKSQRLLYSLCIQAVICLVATCGSSPALRAQSSIEGIWQGSIKNNGSSLKVVFVLSYQDDSLTAVLDSPDQYVKDIPTNKVYFRNDTLYLRSNIINASFKGVYLREEDAVKGYLTQHGAKYRLKLNRAEERVTWNRPQTPQPPFPYRDEAVEFLSTDRKTLLKGTLCIPEGEGPFPVVVMVSGSGWQDRDETIFGHQPFRVIADHLARHGIASLRYDDRTTDANTSELSTDAEGALQFLQKDSRFPHEKIGIFGHSEGGTIAWMVAARNHTVGFIVSMGGVVAPMETMTFQFGKAGVDSAKIPATLESLKQHRWFRCFLDIDGKKLVRKCRCPVLAVNGDKDVQVPVCNVEYMRQWGKPHPLSEFVIYPSHNHMMQRSEEEAVNYGKIEETIDPAFLEKMTAFIQKIDRQN